MKYILSIAIFFLLQGCLDSEKHGQNTQIQTTTASQVAYLPFVENIDKPKTISLYRTKGNAKSSKKLHEISSQETASAAFNNFMIFGNYIYYDFEEGNYGFEYPTTVKHMRTHIDTNKTDELIDIGEVSYSRSNRSNRVIINDTFYMKRRNQNTELFYLERHKKDGSSQRIEYIETIHNDTWMTDVPMVPVKHSLYIPTNNGIVSFNPKEDSFSTIFIDENLSIRELVTISDTLYFWAYNNTLVKQQLWNYDIETKKSTLIHTFGERWAHSRVMHKNGKKIFLFFSEESFKDYNTLVYDTKTQKVTSIYTLTKPRNINFLEPHSHNARIRNYNNLIYYSAFDENDVFVLWRSDGTVVGTKKVLDTQGNTIKPRNLTVIEDKLYFANSDNAHGEELWVIDEKGARLLIDINAGTESSSPRYMSKLNDGIVFQAKKDGVNHLYYYHGNTLKMLK